MAHFAEIDENNVVVRVLRVPDEQEHRGHDYLANDIGLGGRWIQTSCNTYLGVHAQGKTPLRLNHPGIGYAYNEELDAFILPCPFPSWTLDVNTGSWVPPTPMPTDGKRYSWNEETLSWDELEQ
jgi:hypothetical protein